MAKAAREARWLHNLLKELHFNKLIKPIDYVILDMRDFRLHFSGSLDITSSDAHCTISAPDVRCQINNMLILSGSLLIGVGLKSPSTTIFSINLVPGKKKENKKWGLC